MIERILQIGRWHVVFFFADEEGHDVNVLGTLEDMGATKEILDKASELMEGCEYDCGFTFSNPRARLAAVYIGPTSSGAEFQDSFVHELRNLADAIARSLGIQLDGEAVAYLSGDAAREFADIICRLGCEHCRS